MPIETEDSSKIGEDRQMSILGTGEDVDGIIFVVGLPWTIPEFLVKSLVHRVRSLPWRRTPPKAA